MTVGELKELLKDVDDSKLVVLAKDSEGNNFSPMDGADTDQVFVPHIGGNWYGDVHCKELTSELIKLGYTEEDIYDGDDGEDAIVLWPSN